MRHALVICLVLALMFPAQSFAAVLLANDNGRAGQVAATSSQQDDQTKKKKQSEEDKKKAEQDQGTLNSFEAEAKNKKATAPDSVKTKEVEVDDNDTGLIATVAEGLFFAFMIGTVGSWYRVTGHPSDSDMEGDWGRREPGESVIPYAALNFSYEGVRFSDVDAVDGRFEGGYGPLGVQYRFTRFQEKNPDTHIDLSWLHGVLRESYTKYVEVGFAFGAVFLDGKTSDSGFSFAIPIRVAPVSFASLEYRPTWGWITDSTITDEDLALCVGIRYVSLRAGYRWTKAQNTTLEGPIVGLMLSW
jgi:hypothetical protein